MNINKNSGNYLNVLIVLLVIENVGSKAHCLLISLCLTSATVDLERLKTFDNPSVKGVSINQEVFLIGVILVF